MRIFSITLLVLSCAASARAGMTAEQMRARIADMEAVLAAQQSSPIQVDSGEFLLGEMRDLDRRRFESDLELARVNARREVILIRAKEEEGRNHAENEVLQRKLDAITKQRSIVQSDMAKTSEKVDAGTLPPSEVTAMKLQLIKLDEEAATLEYQMSGGGSHFSDALAEIEIDLAGINAVRKALDHRGDLLQLRYKAMADKDGLDKEYTILKQELARIEAGK